MANYLLQASIRAVNRHGLSSTYTKVTTGVYDVESGSVTNTETLYTVVMYRKHIRANQFNYPTLVDKSVGLFYLANNGLLFKPSAKDKIDYNGEVYLVESVEDGQASGEIILYKILAIKT